MHSVAIHQPNYIPWAGYFSKMSQCDAFVFLDDAQFTKNGFINRNRIKTPHDVKWLTVPVHAKLGKAINETNCANQIWPKKHLKTLKSAYGRSSYYDEIITWFKEILSEASENIAEVNMRILKEIGTKMRFSCRFYRSSNLQVPGKGDDRLINIIRKIGGNEYVSGYGGDNYQNTEKFSACGIRLKYYYFEHPIYEQLWGPFIRGLSIIDMLFNCGFEQVRSMISESSHKGVKDVS
jgi:hypothetical protein